MIDYFVEWWLLEILSWSFSAICMGGIVVVLLSYDGYRTPDWPMGMTINGFISVLSNFAKSALLLSTAEALGQLKWSKSLSFTTVGFRTNHTHQIGFVKSPDLSWILNGSIWPAEDPGGRSRLCFAQKERK